MTPFLFLSYQSHLPVMYSELCPISPPRHPMQSVCPLQQSYIKTSSSHFNRYHWITFFFSSPLVMKLSKTTTMVIVHVDCAQSHMSKHSDSLEDLINCLRKFRSILLTFSSSEALVFPLQLFSEGTQRALYLQLTKLNSILPQTPP
jgi:hypothetical protein